VSGLHVLERVGNQYRVALHITVPTGNNSAGVSWANVLIKSGLGGDTVLADGTGTDGGISAAEKASIAGGTVLEVTDLITPPSQATTPTTINAWLDAYEAVRAAEESARILATHNQFGRIRP
jgi:hypothetical protein